MASGGKHRRARASLRHRIIGGKDRERERERERNIFFHLPNLVRAPIVLDGGDLLGSLEEVRLESSAAPSPTMSRIS